MVSALIDNDILHKTVIFDLYKSIYDIPRLGNEKYGVIASCKFVISNKIKKFPPTCGSEKGLSKLQSALESIEEIEPTDKELAFAAEIEYLAQLDNLAFDIGESQLCAILIERDLSYLLSGDKRAIISMEKMLPSKKELKSLEKRIICLEQLVLWLTEVREPITLRRTICDENTQDCALSICFSCSSPVFSDESCIDGLRSYVRDLRKQAPEVLVSDA